jgi:hypothetical protein
MNDPGDQPIGLNCPWCGQHPSLIVGENIAFCGNDDCKLLKWDPRQTRADMEASGIHWLSLTGTSPGQPGVFTCPCCGAVSHHADDAANGYCARCRWWTADPDLGAAHLAAPCPHRTAASGEAARTETGEAG